MNPTQTDVEIRRMRQGDQEAVMTFARALPPHDLLFLPRDITHPKVVNAWVDEIGRGALTSLLAMRGETVVGNATIVRDPLSWSAHVAELRVVLLPTERGAGLGRRLTLDAFNLAVDMGIEKIVAQMTADQSAAIAVFETMGYRAEALLRDHVKGRDGEKHDLVILSYDVEQAQVKADAYGLSEPFNA